MNKKVKAAIAGLAFVAGCEIGIALQLVKMIHNYTVKEAAGNEPLENVEPAGDEPLENVEAEGVEPPGDAPADAQTAEETAFAN